MCGGLLLVGCESVAGAVTPCRCQVVLFQLGEPLPPGGRETGPALLIGQRHLAERDVIVEA